MSSMRRRPYIFCMPATCPLQCLLVSFFIKSWVFGSHTKLAIKHKLRSALNAIKAKGAAQRRLTNPTADLTELSHTKSGRQLASRGNFPGFVNFTVARCRPSTKAISASPRGPCDQLPIIIS